MRKPVLVSKKFHSTNGQFAIQVRTETGFCITKTLKVSDVTFVDFEESMKCDISCNSSVNILRE